MPSFKLKINEAELRREIQKELKATIHRSIPRLRNALNNQLPKLIHKHLSANVPQITGDDYHQLGVPDVNERLLRIIDVAAESFEVKVTPANLLRIDIGILRNDYSSLLDLPEAVFAYVSNRGNGILQWLDWLLIRGNEPLIEGFHFQQSRSRFSRTGNGLMFLGGTWHVPDNLAGTPNDNVLTRALENIKRDLELLVRNELENSLR